MIVTPSKNCYCGYKITRCPCLRQLTNISCLVNFVTVPGESMEYPAVQDEWGDPEDFGGNRILLIVHHHGSSGKTSANAEGEHGSHYSINDNVVRVGFSGFAIVLCIAIITLYMSEHSRTEGAAPPCITDLFRVGASTIGTGCI